MWCKDSGRYFLHVWKYLSDVLPWVWFITWKLTCWVAGNDFVSSKLAKLLWFCFPFGSQKKTDCLVSRMGGKKNPVESGQKRWRKETLEEKEEIIWKLGMMWDLKLNYLGREVWEKYLYLNVRTWIPSSLMIFMFEGQRIFRPARYV